MKNILFLLIIGVAILSAQTNVNDRQIAFPLADRAVYFNLNDSGVSKPINWGLDLAWLSENNVRRGVMFMGAENVDLIRSSFQPTHSLVNGEITNSDQLYAINERCRIINTYSNSQTQIVLNSDHPSVDPFFVGNASNWSDLIEATAKLHLTKTGRKILTVSPFNEPDYSQTGQGTIQDFYNICAELKKRTYFNDIRISGGNTLNNDFALNWYNYLKINLDEGNTHQLAGTFDTYANFFTAVRANGDHATGDELHNIMDAMVGSEYGMQTGIWWGTAEYARGEFCKATNGKRLAYNEHRPNWTSASVYRTVDGKIQAFGGGSERQSVTTKFRFVADRDVFYDGYGPQREYVMTLPGGEPNTYQTALHVNPEQVVNVTWGEDIQAVINGRYMLVNRNSGKVMEIASGSLDNGANIRQNTNLKKTYQQWDVTPVSNRIGGDFSYFKISNVNSGKCPDVLNWSLENDANVIAYDLISANQQWYFEYAGNGWYYIRNRHSSKCLQVAGSYPVNTMAGASIVQWEKNGAYAQQWRLIPIDATVEFVAPAAPASVNAYSKSSFAKLTWSSSVSTDLSSYEIFRSDAIDGEYNTIARSVKDTSFIDFKVKAGRKYFYKIKAVDYALNKSVATTPVEIAIQYEKALLAQYLFDGNTLDNSGNNVHSEAVTNAVYGEDKNAAGSITLDKTSQFVQLPSGIANQDEMTVSTWIYWTDGAYWQRIFDFGNNTDQYMFLTTLAGKASIRFAMKNDGTEQTLDAPMLAYKKWAHVAVTIGQSEVKIFIDGVVKATSTNFTIKPSDFNPAFNYIGRSQFDADALLGAKIDDFRVYNYALTDYEVGKLAGLYTSVEPSPLKESLLVWPNPVEDYLMILCGGDKNLNYRIYNLSGELVYSGDLISGVENRLRVSNLKAGVYILKLLNNQQEVVRKFVKL